MSRTENQKLKLYYVYSYLFEYSDENHPASAKDIISYLDRQGITAERKSIYQDIAAINEMGVEVQLKRGSNAGYYMTGRQFEEAELKLLVDAVQSSKFISEKKSDALIKKIEKLTSHYSGQKLQREVYVANRVKTDNESVLYNIDYIHEAISSHKILNFKYCEWNEHKELIPKHNGKVYEVSPFALVWDDEYYYLVAYDAESGINKHYRVDKIKEINVSSKAADNKPKDFDVASYAKAHFGMYSGHEESVTLEFDKKLVGVVIDRFGKNSTVIRRDEKTLAARVNVQVSNQFFAWVTKFAGELRISSPAGVKEEFGEFIDRIKNSL